MDTIPDREVAVTCGACSQQLTFALAQARCINDSCPLYWKGQGGIELLRPSQGYVPTGPPRAVSVILKPQDM